MPVMLLLGLLVAAQDLPDLGTRKTGSDWPQFLGPAQDSTSAETGLVAPWPAAGPRLVWQRGLGPSYGMPVIKYDRQSRGAIAYLAVAGEVLRRTDKAGQTAA